MTTMVEQIARALCVASGRDPDHLEPGDAFGIDGYKANGDPAHFYWKHWVPAAQAAIRAMREPDEAMLEAVDCAGEKREWLSGKMRISNWQIMIDAALGSREVANDND